MKLCWNAEYGPMPVNAQYKLWRVVHVLSGEDLSDKIFYADDDAGEIWRFEEDSFGRVKIEDGRPVVEKLVLGPRAIRLEQCGDGR